MQSIYQGHDITLRRLGVDDLRPFQAYRQDPDIARYQSWADMSDEDAQRFLTAMQKEPLLTRGEWSQIAIARSSDNLLIGDMGWFISADGTEAELGITLAKPFHGKGWGEQATRAAITAIFDGSTAKSIYVWADIQNLASRALARRAGFTSLGIEETDGITEEKFEMTRAAAKIQT